MKIIRIILTLFLVAGLGTSGFFSYEYFTLKQQNQDLTQSIRAENRRIEEEIAEQLAEIERIQAEATERCNEVSYFNRHNSREIARKFPMVQGEVRSKMNSQCPDVVEYLSSYVSVARTIRTSMTTDCSVDGWGNYMTAEGLITNTSNHTIDVWFDVSAESGGFPFSTEEVSVWNMRPGNTQVWSRMVSTGGYEVKACSVGEINWWFK